MGSFSDDQYKCLFRQSRSLETEGRSSSASFGGEERQLKACSLLHTHPDIRANKSFLTDFHYEEEKACSKPSPARKKAYYIL
nr:hypothetical protein [Tanacetum cinerariifolium]